MKKYQIMYYVGAAISLLVGLWHFTVPYNMIDGLPNNAPALPPQPPEKELDKVKELGVVPSFFAAHVYHWGDVHVKNFGAERAARISPAGAALERDIPFTFHQDTPVLPPDMLETVWCGVNRLTRSGAVLGPEQKIPVVEALAAVTIRAAWQYFEEGEKGSLREGKRADLVLLERDPLTADPMSLRDIPVLATWKDGRLIYRREG